MTILKRSKGIEEEEAEKIKQLQEKADKRAGILAMGAAQKHS